MWFNSPICKKKKKKDKLSCRQLFRSYSPSLQKKEQKLIIIPFPEYSLSVEVSSNKCLVFAMGREDLKGF